MNAQLSTLIAITEMASKSNATGRKVKSRVLSGKCLGIHEDSGKPCDRDAVKRGLCDSHYQTFRKRRNGQPTLRDRGDYEVNAIAIGKILPSQEIRNFKFKDQFAGD
jgi:hypothetical protein